MASPSGEQFEINCGALRAVVAEVGATLRRLTISEEPVLWGFPDSEISTGGRGQVLCPWPNRLEDGSFFFDGALASAALDEPEHHNAIHGLVRWLSWDVVACEPNSITLSCVLVPQPGYPFRLKLEVRYQVSEVGLTVTTTARNEDDKRLPFGLGFHPYFWPHSGSVDHARLEVPARTHLVVNGRGLPIDAEDTEVGYRSLVRPSSTTQRGGDLSGIVLDDCFTDLERDGLGRWHVSFVPGPSSPLHIDVWGDEHFTHVMCFTADTLPGALRRTAVAIEPMTCAPNALHQGSGFFVIEPGASLTCAWGIVISTR